MGKQISGFILTEKGKEVVARIRANYNAIFHIFGRNAVDRVIYENGEMPYSVIMYAIGTTNKGDLEDMVAQKYAVWKR